MSTIKKLYPGSANITITDSPSTGRIVIDQSGLALASRTLTAGDGLTGGGDLSANRSLAVDGTVVRSTDVRMAAAWQRYNAIRNPEMIVAQRGVGPTNTGGGYSLDGWQVSINGPSASYSQISVAIPADISGNNWYPYIQYAYRLAVTIGASLAAGNYLSISQPIEGNLAQTLRNNPTSFSMLVRSSITGTFSIILRDVPGTSYVAYNVVIASANTWQRVAIPNIPTFSGTFGVGTSACYNVMIGLGAGSSYAFAPTNTWAACTNPLGTTTQTNFAVTGTTFDFTLVQHEPNPVCTPYVKRDLASEMLLSSRYLLMLSNCPMGFTQGASNLYNLGMVVFQAPMRAAPSLASGSSYSQGAGSAGSPGIIYNTVNNAGLNNVSANWTTGTYIAFTGGFTAEL